MILTVAAVKGGVGKTTLSMVLAETMSRARPESPCLLLDLDPQGSATKIAARTDGLLTMVKPLIGKTAGALPRMIRNETAGHDLVIIDTPPGDLSIADAAIGEADFVLVPTEPKTDPMTQALETIDMTDGVAPAAVVLNRVKRGANDGVVAREVLIENKTPVLDIELPDWVAIARIDGATWTTDLRTLSLFDQLTSEVLEAATS